MRRALVATAVLGVIAFTATPAAACSLALPPLSMDRAYGPAGTTINVRSYCGEPGQVSLLRRGVRADMIDRAPISGDGQETTLVNRYKPHLPPGAPYLFEMEVVLECPSTIARAPFLATDNIASEPGPLYTMLADGACFGAGCPANVRAFTTGGAVWNNYYAETEGRGGSIATMAPFDEHSAVRIVTGSGPETAAVFRYSGFSYVAYPNFPGGVNVAAGDVDGDGTQDIVTAAGPGGGPHVKVWKFRPDPPPPPGQPAVPGCSPSIANTSGFYAYAPSFAGGVSVAVADLDGDGRAEIITGALAGGGPHVRVFDEFGRVKTEFMAYDPLFHGGVNVAGGDVTRDARGEIITGAGPGGGPHVRVFDRSGTPLSGFYAYDSSFAGGVFVAAGHPSPAPYASIVTGPGPGGGPHVRVLDASGTALASFYAYEPSVGSGVRVAVAP